MGQRACRGWPAARHSVPVLSFQRDTPCEDGGSCERKPTGLGRRPARWEPQSVHWEEVGVPSCRDEAADTRDSRDTPETSCCEQQAPRFLLTRACEEWSNVKQLSKGQRGAMGWLPQQWENTRGSRVGRKDARRRLSQGGADAHRTGGRNPAAGHGTRRWGGVVRQAPRS